MNEITMDGEYVTRDGRDAVPLARVSDRIIGYTVECDGSIRPRMWHPSGVQHADHTSRHDLIPKPKRHKRTVWLNVYDNIVFGFAHESRASADHWDNDRIACLELHLDFADGEGREP